MKEDTADHGTAADTASITITDKMKCTEVL